MKKKNNIKNSIQLGAKTEVSLSATILHIRLHIKILECPLKMLQSLQMLKVFSKCCKCCNAFKMLQMWQCFKKMLQMLQRF